MTALYELIDLLPSVYEPTFSNRLNQLFTFLKSEKRELTEKEAVQRFLGSQEHLKYFNKLKNKLKRMIINYIILNPSVWVDAEYKALYEGCYKKFMAYKVLLMNGKRRAALDIAKVLLPKLREVELHTLVYTVAIDLRLHYSSVDTSPGLAKKYGAIAQNQLEILKAESFVRSYHSKVCLIQNTRESFTPTIIKEFKEAAEKTRPMLKLGSSYLNRYIYNIIISGYLAEFDYYNIIKYSDEAFASFPPEHPNHKAMRFALFQMKLPALVALGALNEARVLAKKACDMMPTGTLNWHLAHVRRNVVCLHAGDYQKAYNLYKTQREYKCPFPTLKEYWQVIWGYLYVLIKLGKIGEFTEERFSLGKFMNEVPVYSRDKAGNNINILIIQILVRMQRGQYGQIIDRIEALTTYARTYTRNPETVRANIFINMIIKMSAASFHRAGTERKTQKLLDKLNNMPLKIGQNLSIEIVPYEVLWPLVLGMLEDKFRGKKLSRT